MLVYKFTNLSIRCINISFSPSLQDVWIIKSWTTNDSNLEEKWKTSAESELISEQHSEINANTSRWVFQYREIRSWIKTRNRRKIERRIEKFMHFKFYECIFKWAPVSLANDKLWWRDLMLSFHSEAVSSLCLYILHLLFIVNNRPIYLLK